MSANLAMTGSAILHVPHGSGQEFAAHNHPSLPYHPAAQFLTLVLPIAHHAGSPCTFQRRAPVFLCQAKNTMKRIGIIIGGSIIALVLFYGLFWGFIWGAYVNQFWIGSMPPNTDKINVMIRIGLMPDKQLKWLMEYHAYCAEMVSLRGGLLMRMLCW